VLLPKIRSVGWSEPAVYCLTGGLIDSEVGDKMFPTPLVEIDGVKLFRGPPNAGHFGACCAAVWPELVEYDSH